jgi:hypothetical protein
MGEGSDVLVHEQLGLLNVGVGQHLLLRQLRHRLLRSVERLLEFCNRLGVGFFGGRGHHVALGDSGELQSGFVQSGDDAIADSLKRMDFRYHFAVSVQVDVVPESCQ